MAAFILHFSDSPEHGYIFGIMARPVNIITTEKNLLPKLAFSAWMLICILGKTSQKMSSTLAWTVS